MKKLFYLEKAELQAKMERARKERLRRIAEQSEEEGSLYTGGIPAALISLLRALFRRRV